MTPFQTKYPNLGKFLEDPAMEEVGSTLLPFGLFYGHSVYFVAIWYILRLFGIFDGYLAYFTVIWHLYSYLVYFTVIWYILRLFGIFYGYLVYFFPVLHVVPRKINHNRGCR
jgi:hypothetical protein